LREIDDSELHTTDIKLTIVDIPTAFGMLTPSMDLARNEVSST
jgi:hypothetical protein